MSKPLFITIDGIDGVGKSTQIERLTRHLESLGHNVVAVRDPGSTEVGSRLRSLLLDSRLEMHRRTEAMLFMASRCEMVETVIRPSLEAGKTVISDRFLLSTVVYQSIDERGKESIKPESLWRLGRHANDSLEPDLTILLDLSAEQSLARIEGPTDRMESRGVAYMETVRRAFIDQLPSSSRATVTVDAALPIDEVTEQLIQAVDEFLLSR